MKPKRSNKLIVKLTHKQISEIAGSTISQAGWAIWIKQLDPKFINSVHAWRQRVLKAYRNIWPARIDYDLVGN